MMKPMFTLLLSLSILIYACTLPKNTETHYTTYPNLLCEYPVEKPVIVSYSDDTPDILKYQMIVENDVKKNEYIKNLENKIKALCGGYDGQDSRHRKEGERKELPASSEEIDTLF